MGVWTCFQQYKDEKERRGEEGGRKERINGRQENAMGDIEAAITSSPYLDLSFQKNPCSDLPERSILIMIIDARKTEEENKSINKSIQR